jgi:hypothetical protein
MRFTLLKRVILSSKKIPKPKLIEVYVFKMPDLWMGNFVVFYKVIRKQDGKLGCFKVSRPLSDPDEKKLIEEELKILMKAKHKNLIKAYEEF